MIEKHTNNVRIKDYPDVMNIDQMSEILGISSKTGYKLLKQGAITAMKVGRTYRIPKIHVLSYLKMITVKN
ncbi:MAG: helix-turn-helix domain-containing protein [Clostridia bacterium]|jgi:excisionase family DNA binding protein|nr:helix-turn-helix domain-containing protein [Clostridia bacterium]MBR4332194.1 helix-turn-helix domain-containing protein [Clostridia bacterium]